MTDASCAWNNGNNNGNNNNVVGAAALPIVCDKGRPNAGMPSGPQNSIATFQGNAQKHAPGKPGATRRRGGNSVRGTASKSTSRRNQIRIPRPSEKRYFHQLTELASLRQFWRQVRQSRSLRPRIVKFNERLMRNLAVIQGRLRAGHFEFGPYQFFKVREKKMRSITNAPLKDRVAHWLLYEHLMRHWQRRFIHDSYGNLPGRGTHAAVKRVAHWARKPSVVYALQIDISKYYPSILHAELLRVVLAREGDQHIRQMLVDLVESYRTGVEFDHLFPEDSTYRQTTEKGLPPGSLTSQILANIYFNEFDHWVKEVLRVRHYVRYVDDLIFLGSTPEELKIVKDAVLRQLMKLGLTVNPKKIAIRKIENGIPFLGYVIWKNHISAGAYVRRRFGKALRRHEGIDMSRAFDSYRGIFKYTGATR